MRLLRDPYLVFVRRDERAAPHYLVVVEEWRHRRRGFRLRHVYGHAYGFTGLRTFDDWYLMEEGEG